MKRKLLAVFFALLAAAWTIFIWSNSAENAQESGKKSETVYEQVKEITEKVAPELDITEYFIRKSAHFTEYFILELLLCPVFLSLKLDRNSVKNKIFWLKNGLFTLPFPLAVAAADETIQNFSDGRYPSPTDVLIDFSGAFTAFMIVSAALLISRCIIIKKSAAALKEALPADFCKSR